jgi:hypothetical protein
VVLKHISYEAYACTWAQTAAHQPKQHTHQAQTALTTIKQLEGRLCSQCVLTVTSVQHNPIRLKSYLVLTQQAPLCWGILANAQQEAAEATHPTPIRFHLGN